MLKRSILLVLVLSLCLSFVACLPGSDDGSEKIKIKATSTTMLPGDSMQLQYETNVAGASVEWSSSNTDILVVTQSGWVTAVGSGTATIIASAGDYLKDYLDITVSKDVMPSKLSTVLSANYVEIISGNEYDLSVTVQKESTVIEGAGIKWLSSDEAVAKVEDGRIMAIAPGEATVTVEATVGGETARSYCAVTVHEYYRIELEEKIVEAPMGGEFKLHAKVYDANGKQVTVKDGELELITSDPTAILVQEDSFKVINIGDPSVGVRYKGNVKSIPVDIFSVTADFLKGDVSNFYGEVDGVTFSGIHFQSWGYQPSIYFTQDGVDRIKAYAEKNGLTTVTIHVHATLFNNGFVVNGKHMARLQWTTYTCSISELSTTFRFWSQSEGKTSVYLQFVLS